VEIDGSGGTTKGVLSAMTNTPTPDPAKQPQKPTTPQPVSSSKETLKDRLARCHQIKISVIGRKSGGTISIPVWFVVDGQKLYLLPVQGSETQWYKNVLYNPSIRIDARGVGAELRATPVTEAKAVKPVIEKFRESMGRGM
jgi:hypothetical protein